MHMRWRVLAAVLIAAVTAAALVACSHTRSSAPDSSKPAAIAGRSDATITPPATSADRPLPRSVPRFAHVVVVVMENHGYTDIIGNPQAPYLNSLSRQGLSLTRSFAITHPSQPNYLALFSGSTQGVTTDACAPTLSGPNLASELSAAGYTFTGYSEGLPQTGYTGCSAGAYARKHNPWVDFTNLGPSVNAPFTTFPGDYDQLPTVSFVIPDLDHDMHDGTVRQGDQWLHDHLGAYAAWVYAHHSLLIVTWDEDDGAKANQIPTILVGAGLMSGTDSMRSTHYTVLRTIEDAYGLARLGASSTAPPLTADWQ